MSLWRRLTRGLRKRAPRQPAPDSAELDERLASLTRQLRDKLQRFLVTRSRTQGELLQTKEFRLTKNGPGLFRLESPGASIALYTGAFLARRQDGKIQGLLRMGEVALNRAIQDERTLAGFLEHVDPPEEASRALFEELLGQGRADAAEPERLPALSELLQWDPFGRDQAIARSRKDVLAHVLLHGGPELEQAIRGRLSMRLKQQLIEEFERLNGPGSRREMNPHSPLYGLLDYEAALTEFRRTLRECELRADQRRRQDQRRGG